MSDAHQQQTLWPETRGPHRQVVSPGAVWLRAYLDLGEQRMLLAQCRAFLDGPVGAYVPKVRGGGSMHVRMVCLGRHWNALTYQYESKRSDFDGQPVPPVPDAWRMLAADAAASAGHTFHPDICIINAYESDGRMGLHRDNDESRQSIEGGAPVVSISLGDTARFLFGGLSRSQAPEALMLESGDVFVFGGPARSRYHGVSRILPGTAPKGFEVNGRVNLTFRQY
jgi:alkylated DNA repair protein (DNA oxidative demethylase)